MALNPRCDLLRAERRYLLNAARATTMGFPSGRSFKFTLHSITSNAVSVSFGAVRCLSVFNLAEPSSTRSDTQQLAAEDAQ